MIRKFLLLFMLALPLIGLAQQTDSWHGFTRQYFEFLGRKAWVVSPTTPIDGKPWVWRAHFPEWHTDVDSILLTRGFHIAYINTNDMYGSPEAMKIWDQFHAHMVSKGFAEKVALEGVSRGGLYVYSWAKRNTLKVACIYAEAPVCDFKSWPGGKGKSKGNSKDWAALLKSYQFTEAEALAFNNNPKDKLEGLAASKVPILHSISLNDKIVPNEENSFILVNNYIRAGGMATVIPMTRGQQNLEGHHFEIENPSVIADFIFSNSWPVQTQISPVLFHHHRTTLYNSFSKFTNQKKGRVAFMGGSITEHGAWREKISDYLKEKFPDTEFEFINAGISSTGSTPGAFRLEQDVLSRGTIDLFFEEAAVNDKANFFNGTAQIRGMEGIVRHALLANPDMDIIMLHFVDPSKMDDYNQGIVPEVIGNHERVAAHYKINSIDLAKEVTARISAGEFSWEKDFKDLHPSLFGHEVYVRSIKSFLDSAYRTTLSTLHQPLRPQPNILPDPLDRFSYFSGNYLPLVNAKLVSGFKFYESWAPNDNVETRKQFVNIPALVANNANAELKLEFEGSAIGICIASGPDAGFIEYSVDGGKFTKLDLFTPWSSQLHLPWYLVLNDQLKKGTHRLVIKTSAEKNSLSKGNACRILHFLVNGR